MQLKESNPNAGFITNILNNNSQPESQLQRTNLKIEEPPWRFVAYALPKCPTNQWFLLSARAEISKRFDFAHV